MKKNDHDYIIGIDCALTNTGLAILHKEQLLYSDTVETNPKQDYITRATKIMDWFKDIIENKLTEEQKKKAFLMIEDLYFGPNPRNVILRCFVIGNLIGIAHSYGIPYFLVDNMEHKQIFTGNGSAEKEDVQFIAQKQFNYKLTNPKKQEHECDAISIAYSYYYIPTIEQTRLDKKLEKARKKAKSKSKGTTTKEVSKATKKK